MTPSSNATSRNARTAGAASALIVAVMLAQLILRSIFSVFSNLAFAGGDSSMLYSLNPLGEGVVAFGTSVVPTALGAFLAFWLLVPLTAELRIGAVLLRSLIAAVVATALTFVFTAVYAFGDAALRGGDIFYAGFGTAQTVFYAFISVTPLVLLAGVIAWLWVSKPSPRSTPTAGE